jgi:hypothetical protein
MANLTTTSVNCRYWPNSSVNAELPPPLWVVPSDPWTPYPLSSPEPSLPYFYTRLCVASPTEYMQACCLTHNGTWQETCGWTVCATNATDAQMRTCLTGVDQFARGNYSLRAKGGPGPIFTFQCLPEETSAAARAVLGWGVVAAAAAVLALW